MSTMSVGQIEEYGPVRERLNTKYSGRVSIHPKENAQHVDRWWDMPLSTEFHNMEFPGIPETLIWLNGVKLDGRKW